MRTIEEPLALDRVIRRYSRPERLLVIDCLTLWLANQLARHEDVVPRKGHGVAENVTSYTVSVLARSYGDRLD